MLRCATVVAAGLTACASTDLTLDIVDTDADCTPAMFATVGRFSVEIVSADMSCRVRHKCLDDVPVDSVGALEQALRVTSERSGEVLIELPESLAGFLSVSGRSSNACAPDPSVSNPPILCGAVDLVGASTGTLTIELQASMCAEPVRDPCP